MHKLCVLSQRVMAKWIDLYYVQYINLLTLCYMVIYYKFSYMLVLHKTVQHEGKCKIKVVFWYESNTKTCWKILCIMIFKQSKSLTVGSVICGMPVVPSDSKSVVLKETYSVDETVVLSCETNAFETQTITCLADGTWSNAGFTCGREKILYQVFLA